MFVFSPFKSLMCFVLQKLEPDSAMPAIKQERPDDSCVPAGGVRCMGSMQKVPSLSDLSDPESSLGEYQVRFITSDFLKREGYVRWRRSEVMGSFPGVLRPHIDVLTVAKNVF